jgi:hypothetical protein
MLSILKYEVKQIKFIDEQTPSSRIIENSRTVPLEHLHDFIQHSMNQFDDCLNTCAI